MKKHFLLCSMLLATMFVSAQQDSVIYETVEFNSKNWMVRNLDVATYRNGDTVPEARTAQAWQQCAEEKKGCWCYYNNDPKGAATYGKLYNWFAVSDERGLAPAGFHVPSRREFDELSVDLYDMKQDRFVALIAGGVTELNLPLPGWRLENGQFDSRDSSGCYWASTKGFGINSGSCLRLIGSVKKTYLDYKFRTLGFAVRCIED